MTPSDDTSVARSWLAAARDPRIAQSLESVYAMIADEITKRAPACWASGRCCNFKQSGHLLYVTGLEAAYAVARLTASSPRLSPHSLEVAVESGGCPFQVGNLCGIHTIKPLGCRVYFCDRSAQEWQQALTERAMADIRALHDRENIDYRYAEWRSLLSLMVRCS